MLANSQRFSTTLDKVAVPTARNLASVFEKPCPSCATRWTDQASLAAGVHLNSANRRQLIAALLARHHIILSGPSGSGKRRLAQSLSLAMALDRADHVFTLQGHPWWAAETSKVTHFVEMQAEYSLWRLSDFVHTLSTESQPLVPSRTEAMESPYIVCIERMSPAEIELYFGGAVNVLFNQQISGEVPASVRFVGTFDSDRTPELDPAIRRIAALVHLERNA